MFWVVQQQRRERKKSWHCDLHWKGSKSWILRSHGWPNWISRCLVMHHLSVVTNLLVAILKLRIWSCYNYWHNLQVHLWMTTKKIICLLWRRKGQHFLDFVFPTKSLRKVKWVTLVLRIQAHVSLCAKKNLKTKTKQKKKKKERIVTQSWS